MSVRVYLEAFGENIEDDHFQLYMAHAVTIGWLGFLTISMVPEEELGILPEVTIMFMAVLMISPLLPGATAAVNEWRANA